MHPLQGVRILTVEQYGAGPFGTMWLADQGAEVIKIEPPDGGDFARALGPYWFKNGESQWFHAYNRNKKSLTLDLKAEAGQAAFRKLAATADAVLLNLSDFLIPRPLGRTGPCCWRSLSNSRIGRWVARSLRCRWPERTRCACRGWRSI